MFNNHNISAPQLELGVIFHCFDGTLYTARKGHGAFCDGVRLQVSKEKGLLVFIYP